MLSECLAESDEPALILCDVEAYEGVLIDPAGVPALVHATMLVEVHDLLQPGLSELLWGRFHTTHDITNIPSVPRAVKDYPFRAWWQRVLPRRYVVHPLYECRFQQMNWFWMRPLNTA